MAYQRYRAIRQRFATHRSTVEKILDIFGRTGTDEVITHEIVGNNLKVSDFIIKSDAMDQSLSKISLEIDQILLSSSQNFGSHFYFSKYGGSKTQFIAMLKDYFIKEKPKVIPINIEDISAINSEYLFNRIIPRTYEKINSVVEDRSKIYDIFLELQTFASQIQIGLIGNQSKSNIIQILSEMNSITENPKIKERTDKIENLIENIQITDDEKVVDLLSKIMTRTSKLDFIYVFFFDEIDLWFKEEEPLEFSKKFLEKTRIIKKVLDLYKGGSKLYYVFCCTDRIHYLLSQRSKEFENLTPVANRFCSIFNNSEKTFEDGNYGDQLEEAIYTISGFFSLVKQCDLKEDYLNSIINSFKIKYRENTRRVLNSKLISLLNSYKEILPLIENGLRKIDDRDWISIGDIIPEFLPSIFKKLGLKWIKEEIPVDESLQRSLKKLDGKFIVGEVDPKVVLSEVKTAGVQDFPQNKVEQVLEAVHYRQEPVILLVWGQFKKEDILSKISSFINTRVQLNYNLDYIDKIYPVIVDNYISFAPIIGLNSIGTDTTALKKCIDATAIWLDELSHIRDKLFEIWQKLGIMPKFEKSGDKGTENGKDGKKPKKEEILANKAIKVLLTLKKKKEYTATGTKRKASIFRITQTLGFGIEQDLDQIYELLYNKNIISNITIQSVIFSEEFIKKQSLISEEELQDYCKSIILS